jgi:hypothetical protein
LKSQERIALIKQFGWHAPRNRENLAELEDLAGHKSGIYVLYHGMPVYLGRGQEASGTEPFWDGFRGS